MKENFENQIPEYLKSHLEEILNKLKSNHASVMVGAGFSKNARKVSSSSRDFPDWNQLGIVFFEKIHRCKPREGENFLNVSRLAAEVDASFGRPVLNQILSSSIPDNEYEPSKVYVNLLKLPWSDIFTTNYDTLLERTRIFVTNQKFDLVENENDIIFSNKPRIVKLHGSFPKKNSLIITEEDYREYPKKHAPFVNTVQQSLLENILCLIGFSGDDPNFFHWTGWIRDNLGKSCTKIYLIGLNDFSETQKNLLITRNIIPLDLSQIPEVAGDYEKALNLFLEYLYNKIKCENNLDWPIKQKKRIPDVNQDITNYIYETIEDWEVIRLKYPNWIVLPEDNREKLWFFTENWIDCIKNCHSIDKPYDLKFLYELNWRIEKCLFPICNYIVEDYEKILGGYNPFPKKITIENAITPEDSTIDKLSWKIIEEQWIELQFSIMRKYREEYDLYNWRAKNQIFQRIYPYLSSESISRLHYERCLFYLFTTNISDLKFELKKWPIEKSLPFWEVKRAGILAELGIIVEANKILEEALYYIRSKLNLSPILSDYYLISMESYTLQHLKYVNDSIYFSGIDQGKEISEEEIKELRKAKWEKEQNDISRKRKDIEEKKNDQLLNHNFQDFESEWNIFSKDKNSEEWKNAKQDVMTKKREQMISGYNERLDNLKQYKCDPWNELKLFSIHLNRPQITNTYVEQKNLFDLGRITSTVNDGNISKEILKAYSFLRFIEEIGIPFRIFRMIFGKDAAVGAINRIADFSLFWSLATMIRLRDSNLVDSIFNRKVLSSWEIPKIDSLIDHYLSVIEGISEEIEKRGNSYKEDFVNGLAQVIPEILSRLCVKCSNSYRDKLLIFLKKLYESNQKEKYRGVKNLTYRLVNSYSNKAQVEIIPQLLDFPILSNLNLITNSEFLDPFRFISFKKELLSEYKNLSLNENTVDDLIGKVRSENKDERSRAVLRVFFLYDSTLLNKKQIEEYISALYSQIDSNSKFPDNIDFPIFMFLRLPHPIDFDPFISFKRYISEGHFPIQKKGTRIAFTFGNLPYVDALYYGTKRAFNEIGIDWTESEAMVLFSQLIEWWDADKKHLKTNEEDLFLSPSEEFRYRFRRLVDLFADVVAPRLPPYLSNETKSTILRFLDELEKNKISYIYARSACLHMFPEMKNSVYRKISDVICSSDSDKIDEALTALLEVSYSNKDSSQNECQITELMSFLGQQIKWRRVVSLTKVLDTMSFIVKNMPQYLNEMLLSDVLLGLGFLKSESDIIENRIDEDIAEKLKIRKYSANLAYRLFKYYSSKREEIPAVIVEWKAICSSPNEFSEIRSQWFDN